MTSDLGVGGVVRYVVSVTGEGCGCVSVNVSTNTTSVTCSGWKVKGQTCVFEVRTLTQCGLVSDRVVESVTLAVPLTPTQLSVKPDYRELQFVDIEFTGVNTTSYNNLSYLIKAYGIVFSLRSEACNISNHCILRIYAIQIPAFSDMLQGLNCCNISVRACNNFACGDSVLHLNRDIFHVMVTPWNGVATCNVLSSLPESSNTVCWIRYGISNGRNGKCDLYPSAVTYGCPGDNLTIPITNLNLTTTYCFSAYLSKDDDLIASVHGKFRLFCDPAELVNSWPEYNYNYPLIPTSFNDPGMIVIGHGIISFNGITPGFTARLTCDRGAAPSGSIVRTCMDNGTWSGYNQYCFTILTPTSGGGFLP